MNDHVLSASPTIDQHTRACLALWAAVMADGIKKASAAYAGGRMDHPDVRWLFENGDTLMYVGGDYVPVRDIPGQFIWICNLLGFDPDQARSKVRMNMRILARKERADVSLES